MSDVCVRSAQFATVLSLVVIQSMYRSVLYCEILLVNAGLKISPLSNRLSWSCRTIWMAVRGELASSPYTFIGIRLV